MVGDEKFVVFQIGERKLTAREFQSLADVPPEAEWFANIENVNTRRAYKCDVHDFMAFAGIRELHEFRAVKRSHLIAWRKPLEMRALEAPTIRRKLSSLFDFLCESNAVEFNPADALRRTPVALAKARRFPWSCCWQLLSLKTAMKMTADYADGTDERICGSTLVLRLSRDG